MAYAPLHSLPSILVISPSQYVHIMGYLLPSLSLWYILDCLACCRCTGKVHSIMDAFLCAPAYMSPHYWPFLLVLQAQQYSPGTDSRESPD